MRIAFIALAVVALITAGLGAAYFYQTRQVTPQTQEVSLQSGQPQETTMVEQDATPVPKTVQTMGIGLTPQNDSNMYGSVTFSSDGNQTKVSISVTDEATDGAVPRPAHIHTGSCPTPGEVKYPLTNVVDGRSETTLNVSLSELAADVPLAINIHKSAQESSVYFACGDFPTS